MTLNPYEAPQTSDSLEAYLLQDGLTSDQIQLFCGYKACALAGKKLSLGMCLLLAFYVGIYQIQRLELFDVRYCYIAGLYPLYLLLVGGLLNRQGLSLLAQHASLSDSKADYRLCSHLAWAKLLTLVCSLSISALSLDLIFVLGTLCLWPVLELMTILLQFSILRDKGNTSELQTAPAMSDYLGYGLAAMLLITIGLILQAATHIGTLPLSSEITKTTILVVMGIGLFMYALQLKLYEVMYEYLARTYLRDEP